MESQKMHLSTRAINKYKAVRMRERKAIKKKGGGKNPCNEI